MSALLLLLRTQVRGRWRAWLGLAVLVGVIAGAIIATLAGARRTETAYARFLEGTRAFDVSVTNGGTTPDNLNRQFDFDEVAALPEVRDAARLSYYVPSGSTGTGRLITPSDMAPFASPDGKFGTALNELRVVEGRLPRGERELAVTLVAADRLDVGLGSTLRLRLDEPARMADPRDGAAEPMFRVVGIVAMQAGFPPMTGGLPPPVILSTAYANSHPAGAEVLAVRLRRGPSGIPAFERELTRLAGGEQIVTANRTEFASVERSLSVQATALRLVAGLVAGVALLLLGQVLVRRSVMQGADDRALRALGVTGGQLRSTSAAWGALMAVAAAGVAAVVAVGLSGLTPVGIARQAELKPGVELNLAYVGLGAVAVVALVTAANALSGWMSTRRMPRSVAGADLTARPSRLREAVERTGLPIAAASGLRMALEPGQGRSAVPVRSTIATATFAVAMISGVMGFSASLSHLFDDPQLYGWNWDVQIGDAFAPALDAEAGQLIENPTVEAVSVGTEARIEVGGTLVDAMAIEPRKGSIEPVVVDGRSAAAADEIMLGTRTLRDLGVDLGDTVSITLGDRSARFTVVGRGILAEFAGAARLGEGAALTFAGMGRLMPHAVADVVLVRVHPGAVGDALLADLVRGRAGNIYLPEKPSDLADLERVGGLPFVLAALLGTMAVATLANALTSSVRRRRRELAMLKVLGLMRAQIFAVVAWQSSVIAVIAVALGLPLGVGVGQSAWQVFADRLGVPPRPVTPVLAIVVVVPAVLVLANLTAALPARWAARTSASAALRAVD